MVLQQQIQLKSIQNKKKKKKYRAVQLVYCYKEVSI